jgi:hypothetical protein
VICFGLLVIALTMMIPNPSNLQEVGPRAFPLLASIGLIICGIGIFFQKVTALDQKNNFNKAEIIKIIIFMAILFAYYFVMKFVGYYISTVVFLWLLIRFLKGNLTNKSGVFKDTLITFVITTSLYFMFTRVFLVILPKGQLF